MVPYKEKARLEILTPHAFRTLVHRDIACCKRKDDDKGNPFDVVRTINTETAQGVLECSEFWIGLREILAIRLVPTFVLDPDAATGARLLQRGYDEKTKTLTFG